MGQVLFILGAMLPFVVLLLSVILALAVRPD